MKHIIGLSGGKDSMASTILAHILKKPVSELVYCRVMFDEEISAEVPEHDRFLHEVAFPKIKKDFGYKIVTVRSEKNYVDLFNTPITKGPRKGLLR
jgi:tRNA(Ile)-lysidine synthase TilS/MesJ